MLVIDADLVALLRIHRTIFSGRIRGRYIGFNGW